MTLLQQLLLPVTTMELVMTLLQQQLLQQRWAC
jgi:hypothetical protein